MNKFILNLSFIIAFCCFSMTSLAATPSKKAFLDQLRALINPYNAQIVINRQRIYKISEQYLNNDDISEADFNWLKQTADRYQLAPKQRNDQAFFSALLARVDIIPTNLILALAVTDGAWAYTEPNQQFRFLCLSLCQHTSPVAQRLDDFFLTLNTHAAYYPFREQRRLLRQQQKALKAQYLIDSLATSPAYNITHKVIKKLLYARQWQKMDTL